MPPPALPLSAQPAADSTSASAWWPRARAHAAAASPSSSCSDGSARASSSHWQSSACPESAANISGVAPSLLRASTAPPAPARSSRSSARPPAASGCGAQHPSAQPPSSEPPAASAPPPAACTAQCRQLQPRGLAKTAQVRSRTVRPSAGQLPRLQRLHQRLRRLRGRQLFAPALCRRAAGAGIGAAADAGDSCCGRQRRRRARPRRRGHWSRRRGRHRERCRRCWDAPGLAVGARAVAAGAPTEVAQPQAPWRRRGGARPGALQQGLPRAVAQLRQVLDTSAWLKAGVPAAAATAEGIAAMAEEDNEKGRKRGTPEGGQRPSARI
ncbi:unnamed protein product [Prorocentrum cordatum]|uniref:Uncharacterized protein n=1 Tax=Prorocentrum cordatum TaxID=2364126 RepID=A0ABN9PYL8_9DINO|nr:unnamed protein product [Polarella glacialis]